MTEAEEEIASALSLPDFPTANTQKRIIEDRAAALYAGEIAIPSDVVDEILRTGSNRDRSQLRIIYNFMIEQTPEEYTDFVRREWRMRIRLALWVRSLHVPMLRDNRLCERSLSEVAFADIKKS